MNKITTPHKMTYELKDQVIVEGCEGEEMTQNTYSQTHYACRKFTH